MQITRASEYGVLGLLALARRPFGELVLLETIASEEDIPVSFLGKIFQSLARAGLVKSVRGSGGGFALAQEPGSISALAVIEAVEGPMALTRCLDETTGCEHSGGCALCSLFAEAQDRVKEVFQQTTVATLSNRHIPGGRVRSARDRAGNGGGSSTATVTFRAPKPGPESADSRGQSMLSADPELS